VVDWWRSSAHAQKRSLLTMVTEAQFIDHGRRMQSLWPVILICALLANYVNCLFQRDEWWLPTND
jgi:hypothetical protein